MKTRLPPDVRGMSSVDIPLDPYDTIDHIVGLNEVVRRTLPRARVVIFHSTPVLEKNIIAEAWEKIRGEPDEA